MRFFKNLNKNIISVISIFVVILGIAFFAISAIPTKNKASDKIRSYLKNKYSKEFIVESIGAGYGSYNNNTWKALAKPKDDPLTAFDVIISKDLKEINDYYIGSKLQNTIENMLVNDIRENGKTAMVACWNDINLESNADFPIESGQINMMPRDYYVANPKMRPVTFVVIRDTSQNYQIGASSVLESFKNITGRNTKLAVYFADNKEWNKFQTASKDFRSFYLLTQKKDRFFLYTK